MACGSARHEAYTAGGEATLMSLEIPIVDAFVFLSAEAALQAPSPARPSYVSWGRRTSAKPRNGLPENLGDPIRSTCHGRNPDHRRKQWVRVRSRLQRVPGANFVLISSEKIHNVLDKCHAEALRDRWVGQSFGGRQHDAGQ